MTKLPPAAREVKRLTNFASGRPTPLGDLMRQAHQRLVAYLDRALTDSGYSNVRSAHVSVLATIDADGSRLATLVQRGGRTKQATAQLAGHLLDEGYVTLGPDATDGRAKLYVPTEAGWALLAIAEQVVIGYEKWLDQMLGQDAIDQLRRILTTIVDEPARDDAPRSAAEATRPGSIDPSEVSSE
ncbi:MarR family winged helix-turn-helix transcriptional regulator [Parafrigoribacterium mesophilum]|uniref:MarR family winged helix-turn-helix transcriptional regulator n=1 Tax=Parafrigoribacterium mesophilum TaxID=433646 RepID=UPI0031FBB36E